MSRASGVTGFQHNIEHSIIEYIRKAGLMKGDRLPAQYEFAKQLKVSPTALREAMARMTQDGIIRQAHGIGTFVAEDLEAVYSSAEINLSLTEMIRALNKTPGTTEIEVSVANLTTELSHCFDENPSKALLVKRVRTADGSPFAYSIAYLSLSIPNLSQDPEPYKGSIYQYLYEQCNEFISESDAEIEAYVANKEIGQKLRVPEKTPLLVLKQRHQNINHRTLIVSIEYFVRNSMRLQVKRSSPEFGI